jgi:hypothetical protein
MNKALLLVLALMTVPLLSDAEVFLGARKGIGFGFHYMSSDKDDDLSLMPGFTGGLVAGMPIAGAVKARVELLMSGKGRRDKQEDRDIRIATVELPLLVRAEVPVGPEWLGLAVMTGPVVSYRIAGSERSEEKTSTIATKELQRLDFGAALAIEAAARIRAYTISLELRLCAGFIPVFDRPGEGSRDALISIGLGYGVHLPTGGG